jgi:transposase
VTVVTIVTLNLKIKAMNTIKYAASTRTQLALRYKVSVVTFKKWLAKIPDLGLEATDRVLTPKQVGIILQHLGEPPDE